MSKYLEEDREYQEDQDFEDQVDQAWEREKENRLNPPKEEKPDNEDRS